MADISTAVSMARVPILGEDGRISDDYIPAAIGEGVESAEAAATRAETAATAAESAKTAAETAATAAESAKTAAETAATAAESAKTAAEKAKADAESAGTAAANSAKKAAGSAQDAQQSATAAQQSAASVADKFIASAQATTLEPGSQATASVENQVLTIGVPKGDKGDKGDTGEKGDPGDKGDPGSAATVSVGSVTTGAPGTDASVTNSGTESKAVLDFVIPRGEKGDPATAISYVDGEYVGLGERFAAMRDARVYGATIPMDGGTICTKTQDNAGIANPVPSTLASPGSDPYATIPAFYHRDVCGYPDANGVPHVTSMDGDGIFRRDGSTGAVCVMIPPIFWSLTYDTPTVDGASEAYLRVSNTPLPGLRPMPEGVNPDGTMRPYGLIPKYVLGMLDGKYTSASGLQPATRTISHDSLVNLLSDQNSEDGTSWSGMSRLARWYVQVMFLLKYATRDSQSIMRGCTQYDYGLTVAADSTDSRSVTVSDASNLVEGSSIMVGSSTNTLIDRENNTAHDVVDYAVIESIGSNVLTLDRDVSVSTGNVVKTAPWRTGACDGLQGDGSPSSNTSGKEPYSIQGVETAVGCYEVMSGVALHSDGTNGWRVMVYRDGQSDVKDVSGSYEDTGVSLPTDSTDSWKYPLNLVDADGVLVGTDTGGSTTTGLCDGEYTSSITAVADKEFLSVGSLGGGGGAGPSSVNGNGGLGVAGWYIGSRLSATRSCGGETAAAVEGA